MPVDAHRLLVLRAVQRAGGVVPAARALYLSPSAVSQHLSRLEAETGLSLVDRARRGGGRTLALTAAGRALAEQGDRVAEALAEAERTAMALRGERSGPVRIGGFATVLRRLVGPTVVDLAISEPSIVPTVSEVGEADGLQQLRAGALDLLLLERLPDAPPPRAVVVEDLLRDPYRVAVPSNWPVRDAPETLLGGPWIAGHEGTPARAALDALAGGRRLDIRHVCDQFPSMLVLVGAGLGATLVTDLVLDFLPHTGVRVSTGPLDAGSRLISVAYRRGRAEPGPAATAVLEALRARVTLFDPRSVRYRRDMRFRLVLLPLIATLLLAAPAQAFTPPEIFVRQTNALSIDHTPQSDWIPLSSAPTLNWLGGYEIGYRFQANPATSNSQRAALQVTGVPDGQPTQPRNEPYCSGMVSVPGTIVPVGTAMQFEGSGTYTVTVFVGPPTGGPADCMTAAATGSASGSFAVDSPVAPKVIGSPLVFRAERTFGKFSGVRAAPEPPGGQTQTTCARDATVAADGSVTGDLVVPKQEEGQDPPGGVSEEEFGRPGAWTCVSRGYFAGEDDNMDDAIYGTPWSAPLRLDVRSDFQRVSGRIKRAGSKRPRLRFTAEFPEAAKGGKATLTLRRFVECGPTGSVYRKVAAPKGSFDAAGRVTLSLRRPREAYYLGTLSFAGNRFYTRSTDPSGVLLGVRPDGVLTFIEPLRFPQC